MNRHPRSLNWLLGFWLLGSVLICLIAGCASAPPPKEEPVAKKEAPDPRSFLGVEISIPQLTYTMGDRIPLKLVLSNKSKDTLNFEFPTSQIFDIGITTAEGKQVTTWGKGKAGLQKITSRRIAPGTSELFTWEWSTADASFDSPGGTENKALPAGTYFITGYLKLAQPLSSKPVAVVIKDKPVEGR